MSNLNAVPTDRPTLDQLCAILAVEKAKLARQQRNVREAEEAIIKVVGAKDEGSFTVHCDNYKVTTTQPVNRVVDPILAQNAMKQLPKDIADSVFTWKPQLSARVYKDIQKYQPQWFDAVSRAVTSKPGKISVKLEDIA